MVLPRTSRSDTLMAIFSVLLIFSSIIPELVATPIVNGVSRPIEPKLGEYPFHANLLQVLGKKKYHSFCGGSLIHPRWVLTAAHCIQEDSRTRAMRPREIHVALGSIYRIPKRAQILRVSKTAIHPTYLRTDRNDIGLLKLEKAAKLGPNVKLIPLHTNSNDNLLKKTAYLTGFGVINDARKSPKRLRKAIMHVGDYVSKCSGNARYKNVEICGVSTITEGKACDGDSGGPLFIIKSGRRVQIGITSYLARSAKCQLANNHSVYTRVSIYISWISRVTGINFNKYNQH